jgi:hypothetical protein
LRQSRRDQDGARAEQKSIHLAPQSLPRTNAGLAITPFKVWHDFRRAAHFGFGFRLRLIALQAQCRDSGFPRGVTCTQDSQVSQRKHPRSDAKPGAIVESRSYEDGAGRRRLSLATRSDLPIEVQVGAPGATWIDRQLLAKDASLSGGGFGADVREAMDRRVDHLVEDGLARRQGQRIIFARDLINTLRRRDLEEAASTLSAETGLAHRPSAEGEHVSGVYRQRVTLSSGRFAMIDDGMGFQLVPWRPALEQQLGRQVSGGMIPGGNVDWSLGRKRGIGI